MLPPFFYSARSRASLLSFPTRRSSDLAGAEAVEVSGHRLVASSAFVDGPEGVAVDGNPIGTQMEWRAIGDPDTMSVALNIPGGALTGFRNAGAVVDLEQRDLVQITAIREVEAPEFAMPVESED